MKWFVDRDPDGTVSRVIRIHDDGGELRGEYYRDGQWVTDPVVLEVLWDGSWGLPVSPEEGEAVIASLRRPS